MKITDFSAEDVDKVVSYLRSACQHLMVVDQLPLDLTTTCLVIFQTSSVPDFNKDFDTFELGTRLGIIKSMEAEEIISKLKQGTKSQEWNVKKVQQSVFTATRPNKIKLHAFGVTGWFIMVKILHFLHISLQVTDRHGIRL